MQSYQLQFPCSVNIIRWSFCLQMHVFVAFSRRILFQFPQNLYLIQLLNLMNAQHHDVSIQSFKRIKNYSFNYKDQIGRGNFARVYLGINTLNNQQVAIKVVSLDQLKRDKLQSLVFEEVAVLQQMDHPNILKFYEALFSQNYCYIVTQVCREGNLQKRIKSRIPFSAGQLERIILDIYEGLKYLRHMKVIHRDLKPANIFMHNGRAKIADFGMAKFYKSNFKDLGMGTDSYITPECLFTRTYGEKTDIWAFGVLIYTLLHGQTPFDHCRNQKDIHYWVMQPLADNRFRPDVPSDLKHLIRALLIPDQASRPNIYQLSQEPYLKKLLHRELPVQIVNKPNFAPELNLNLSFKKIQSQNTKDRAKKADSHYTTTYSVSTSQSLKSNSISMANPQGKVAWLTDHNITINMPEQSRQRIESEYATHSIKPANKIRFAKHFP